MSLAAPKVSFILPAWKRRFLGEAVERILAQTFGDFELVVVDDASPDDLGEVVGRFRDARLRYVRNEKNLGGRDLVAAWNRAFAEARGEFAVLASDDDRYLPRFLEAMLDLARRHPAADAFHCRIAYIDERGERCGTGALREALESPMRFFHSRAVLHLDQSAPDFMFRTAALRSIGGFVPMPRAWYSDDATWMMLARRGGIAFSPEILFESRQSGENISSTFDDAAEKIRAGEMFREWLCKYAAEVPLDDGVDARLAGSWVESATRMVDAMSFWVLHNAPFATAMRAVRTAFPAVGDRVCFAARMFRAASAAACRRMARDCSKAADMV